MTDTPTIGLDDHTVDLVVSELTTHIKKLEAKRLQLIHQRREGHERTELIALVGKDAKAADEILLVLEEFQRAPELLQLALTGEVSVARCAQLAAAVQGISTARLHHDRVTLTGWVTTQTREQLTSSLRRWRRVALAEESQYTV